MEKKQSQEKTTTQKSLNRMRESGNLNLVFFPRFDKWRGTKKIIQSELRIG